MWTVPEALPRRPGDVSGHPKRYREDRGMWAATRSATQKAGCEGPSNIYYLYYLLLPIITYYWLLLPWAMYWSIMMKMIIHAETRLIFVIWHMKQTRPCQTRVTHCDSLEARGIKAQRHFFIDTFFLVIRGKCFYSCTSFPITYMRSTGMRISRQYKVQKVADFLHNHWDLIPSTPAARWTYLASFK